MKTLPLMTSALALLLTLATPAPARAGSAQPGGTRTVTLKAPAATLHSLVGRWQLTGVERNGKAIPLPPSMNIVVELRRDGTARTVLTGRSVSTKLGRWTVQKDVLLVQTRRKRQPERLRFWLQGNQLVLQPPGAARTMRMRFTRLRSRP